MFPFKINDDLLFLFFSYIDGIYADGRIYSCVNRMQWITGIKQALNQEFDRIGIPRL